MAVSVAGVAGREMPGIKAALKAHRDEWVKNGEAVLNLEDGANGVKNSQGEPLTESDPRPMYSHQEYPRMVYHAKLGERVVDDEIEYRMAVNDGYRNAPYPVVRAAVADPGVEKAVLQTQLKEKDGQIATLADQMRELQDQMKELMGAANPEQRRGPGRPRKEDTV
jgi:hypothetical protein